MTAKTEFLENLFMAPACWCVFHFDDECVIRGVAAAIVCVCGRVWVPFSLLSLLSLRFMSCRCIPSPFDLLWR